MLFSPLSCVELGLNPTKTVLLTSKGIDVGGLHDCRFAYAVAERILADGTVAYAVDMETTLVQLLEARQQGATTVLMLLLHAATHTQHAQQIQELALELGFERVLLGLEEWPYWQRLEHIERKGLLYLDAVTGAGKQSSWRVLVGHALAAQDELGKVTFVLRSTGSMEFEFPSLPIYVAAGDLVGIKSD